ncbi:ectonucleotide pyrophosphatase/phosphodiesterase [Dyella jiangningensis]|uniref:alkaline phosphatase family protein n=1 Tax=Dyella jiangningensis TaxID=1379159 RepID=UPI00240FE6CA|nr:ectonucleotide pyrophosphatase/phosphodiesterase [Dyella jiangningensis]MDG2538706.1 ectonucleotide pyrophosphatase/phosphodiesterase [Dyella jiangningensis]
MRLTLRLLCLSTLIFIAGCQSLAPVHAPTSASRKIPLLLISIDGFRADYLDRGYTPTLSMLADHGVHSVGMQPSYPTLTFPNHYTLVTGRYPDHHGVVDNSMLVPDLGKFKLSNREAVADGRWWDQAEPIWVSADRQGLKTATMYWPGSEASIHGYRPDHWRKYAEEEVSSNGRVDQILQWLDLPSPERPRFMTLYFDAVDTAGHFDGPGSAKTNEAIAEVDAALAHLVAGLRERGLFDRINIIVVADHGMADTPANQRIFLDDLIPQNDAMIVSTGAIAGIIPSPGHESDVESVLLRTRDHMQCWKKSEIPAHLHYGSNERVPPIICAADTGWLMTRNAKTALVQGKPILGEHGFDNGDVAMRALFLAHGPAFREHVVLPVFANVDVYPLMTHLLGIQAQPNDGRLAEIEDALVPAEL